MIRIPSKDQKKVSSKRERHLVQASVGNLREVMVLIVVPDIICQRIEGPIVAIRLLTLRIQENTASAARTGNSDRQDTTTAVKASNRHVPAPAALGEKLTTTAPHYGTSGGGEGKRTSEGIPSGTCSARQ